MDGRAAGADRFVALVRHGYYDQARSLRTRPGFWTQFGINSTPEIAKAWRTVESVIKGSLSAKQEEKIHRKRRSSSWSAN